ncbi:hypothetical protein PhiBTCVTUL1a_30 [Burkholderia phage phiBtTUL1a]|nr:hypothetical protein PhiBTCVTUL1a_30 [Burkholderia phage phiBtTUL1a]
MANQRGYSRWSLFPALHVCRSDDVLTHVDDAVERRFCMLLDPAREKRFEFGLCFRRDVWISISSFANFVIGALTDHIDHVVGVAQALGRDRCDVAVEHNIADSELVVHIEQFVQRIAREELVVFAPDRACHIGTGVAFRFVRHVQRSSNSLSIGLRDCRTTRAICLLPSSNPAR